MRRASRFAILVLLALSACSFQREAGDDWVMTLPSNGGVESTAGKAATLKVNLPDAPSWLESSRVAVRRPDGAFDYYAGARWADMLPLQVQSALVRDLSQQLGVTVVADDATQSTLYHLNMRIEDFEVTHDSNMTAVNIRVSFTLQRQFKDIYTGTAVGFADLTRETRADIQQAFTDAYQVMITDMAEQVRKQRLRY